MIRIGIIGEVSVGKSTLLNALVSKYLSATSLKRTTYVPFLFKNSDDEDDYKEIEKIIQDANKSKDNFDTPIEFKTQLSFSNNEQVNIIDFAGVNDGAEIDSKIENVFFKHINNLDYIIYVSDSNSSMTLKSERDFFNKLSNKIIQAQDNGNITKLIVAFNKYDDIIDDENSEVDEIISEAIEFMNKTIKFTSFKISAQKMMVKNVIKKDKSEIKNIPSNIVHKILCEYHGKRKANSIIKSKKIKISDINEIEFTKDEEKFIKYLNKISDKKNYETNLKKFINNQLNLELNYNSLETIMLKYKKYLDIQIISNLFTDKYYNDVININKITTYQDFLNLDRFISKNPKTLLDIEETNKKLFEKTKFNNTETKTYYDRFMQNGFKNLLEWKDNNSNNLLNNITYIGLKQICEDIDKIKSSHSNIEKISNIIDNEVINYLLNSNIHIEYALSMNKYLNTSLCNYLNSIDDTHYEDILKKIYFNNSSNIPKYILDYKPLSNKYEFIPDKIIIYPSKMIYYLNFKKEYETKDKPVKIVKKTVLNSKKYKHDMEIIDSDEEDSDYESCEEYDTDNDEEKFLRL